MGHVSSEVPVPTHMFVSELLILYILAVWLGKVM